MISETSDPLHAPGNLTAAEDVDDADVTGTLLSGTALVLEDNVIIAMDASEILVELGALDVHTASGVDEAMRALDGHGIAFAMLDVNLGDESSLVVARRCVELGIRTILATGYDGVYEGIAGFPSLPMVRKPYTIEQVRAALETADVTG